MSTVQGLVAKSVSTVRRYGFHPVLIGGSALARVQEHRRHGRLREGYPTIVAEPASRPALHAPSVSLCVADELPLELQPAAGVVRGEAELVLAHTVDYLGSGPVDLGRDIDWHLDFKAGYRWPPSFYLDLEITRLDDDSDAKVPWELSRGHQLLTLARAARMYEDERFAAELEAQLDSWLDANPPGYGINWVTPMELAFRAVNWGWAIGTLEGWRPLHPDLRRRVARSLQAHGRHIAMNLEGSPLLRGNHYLANVVGLLTLAAFLPDDSDAPSWWRFSHRALEREICTQVLDDGVGFEASLPYHGLSLEMFLIAWHLTQLRGRPLSACYRDRLARMLAVSRAVRHPDGRSPVFGDQDSGRLLPAGFSRPATQDNLLDLGAAVLDLPRQRDALPHEEVAWTLGLERWRALAERPVDPSPPRSAFPNGGLYVLRGGGAHLTVRWGGVGQNGNGGHSHNDLSSYELSYDAPMVIDSGTFVYTADVAARDAFRSATAHNVLVVDGLDMHPLPPAQPFRLPSHARFEVEEWRETEDQISLTGWHDGFRRAGTQLRCRRRIVLSRGSGTIDVSDEVEGQGRHRLESVLHLSPDARVLSDGERTVDVSGAAGARRIQFTGAASIEIEQGWVSSQYGVRERAPLIRASISTGLPAAISYRIGPA